MPTESFVCLTPRKKRKKKCNIIDAVLSPLGSVRWINTPSVSLRNWPETTHRTDQALICSKQIPKNPVAQEAKRILVVSRYNWARSFFAKRPNAVAVCWNGLKGSGRVFMDGALDAGVRRLFFEWAPLPGRITIDPCGVNFANSLPRDIVTYLNWFAASGLGPNNWRSAGHGIEQRPPLEPLSSECIGSHKITEPFLFAPLQTPGDTQPRFFGGNFRTVEAFVDALCLASAHLPVGWHLRVKEHPTAPHTIAEYLGGKENLRVVLDNATDTFELVAASRGVVTVNSSVGLEALFFDKPVIAAGQCFWAINGVAQK